MLFHYIKTLGHEILFIYFRKTPAADQGLFRYTVRISLIIKMLHCYEAEMNGLKYPVPQNRTVVNSVIFEKELTKRELERPLRYVRVNTRTVIGTREDLSDDEVRKRFNDNLKLSPYFNPKKFFVLSRGRWQ